MKKLLLSVITVLLLLSCGSSRKGSSGKSGNSGPATYGHLVYSGYHQLKDEVTFKLDSVSADETFGYSQQNPVMVGGRLEGGAYNQRRFLNALLGPSGEAITYTRRGSCCPFSTPNGMMGGGLLDMYEVTIPGKQQPVILYLNMYDKGILRAPKGFTFKQ